MIMPHTYIHQTELLVSVWERARYFFALFIFLFRSRGLSRTARLDGVSEFVNGKNNGGLHHKFHFVETLKELGYKVPEQLLYSGDSGSNIQAIIEFQSNHGTVFCKPKDGTRGKGLHISKDSKDLITFLKSRTEPYIIQEFLPPTKDYRYLYHVGKENTYRACYEKRKPFITGNGKTKLIDLINNETDIPDTSRAKILKIHKLRLDKVPDADEVVLLVASGNISQGAYGVLLSDKEHKAIDGVILPLIKDLEEKKGINISTYCFDIGLLRPVDQPNASMKSLIVFYEFQMPFDMTGYLYAPELEGIRKKTQKLLVNSFLREWNDRKMSAT